MSLYGVQFQTFCISRLWEISLYGIFGGSAWFYIPMGKNAVQRKFDGLVTNNLFVIIVTLIITFSIWIVKCCHQALYRYSFGRISPCTIAVLPLFFYENIPQHHSASDTTPSIFQACQYLPGCENFNKLLLPATHTARTHTTRAGKDSQ